MTSRNTRREGKRIEQYERDFGRRVIRNDGINAS